MVHWIFHLHEVRLLTGQINPDSQKPRRFALHLLASGYLQRQGD